MAGARIKRHVETDRGWKRIRRAIAQLDGEAVSVGVQGDAGEHEGTNLVDIAAWNELGTAHIPPRPFMRATSDSQRGRFGTMSAHLVGKLIDRTATVPQVMGTIGQWFQEAVQARMAAGPWAPNAPSTVREKGSNRPLIDTGRLRASIRWVRSRFGGADD